MPMTNGGAGTAMPSEELLRERLTALAIRRDLNLVVLFGSRVKGLAGPRSDLDVAIECQGPADLDLWYQMLTPKLGTDRVDLVDLRRADPLLAFEIARTGRVLFEREPGLFHDFRARASLRYADSAKLRAAQRRAIHVFLQQEGLT